MNKQFLHKHEDLNLIPSTQGEAGRSTEQLYTWFQGLVWWANLGVSASFRFSERVLENIVIMEDTWHLPPDVHKKAYTCNTHTHM